MAGGYQPQGGHIPPVPTTGTGVKPADLGGAERERLARLVTDTIRQNHAGGLDEPKVRVALAIAANAVRRGRHLTDREKLLNLAKGIEEPIDGDTPEEIAEAKDLADRIRASVGAA